MSDVLWKETLQLSSAPALVPKRKSLPAARSIPLRHFMELMDWSLRQAASNFQVSKLNKHEALDCWPQLLRFIRRNAHYRMPFSGIYLEHWICQYDMMADIRVIPNEKWKEQILWPALSFLNEMGVLDPLEYAQLYLFIQQLDRAKSETSISRMNWTLIDQFLESRQRAFDHQGALLLTFLLCGSRLIRDRFSQYYGGRKRINIALRVFNCAALIGFAQALGEQYWYCMNESKLTGVNNWDKVQILIGGLAQSVVNTAYQLPQFNRFRGLNQ
jgi:hypothetical protein